MDRSETRKWMDAIRDSGRDYRAHQRSLREADKARRQRNHTRTLVIARAEAERVRGRLKHWISHSMVTECVDWRITDGVRPHDDPKAVY